MNKKHRRPISHAMADRSPSPLERTIAQPQRDQKTLTQDGLDTRPRHHSPIALQRSPSPSLVKRTLQVATQYEKTRCSVPHWVPIPWMRVTTTGSSRRTERRWTIMTLTVRTAIALTAGRVYNTHTFTREYG